VYIVFVLVILAAVAWIGLALSWAASVARHRPDLHDSGQQQRYGWKCPRCGKTHAPTCRVKGCGGPLVWVQRDTAIKCARCHRRFVAHPFLFRMTPRPRQMWCDGCRGLSKITDWKIG
jgi:hypothetical protein